MTKEELALKLNGREYLKEITAAEEKEAKDECLLVVFGASDDLMELRGDLHDEADVIAGGEVLISGDKILPRMPARNTDDWTVLELYNVLDVVEERRKHALKITAIWCRASSGYAWIYETAAPHASFDIMDDGEKYCRGIVIDLKES